MQHLCLQPLILYAASVLYLQLLILYTATVQCLQPYILYTDSVSIQPQILFTDSVLIVTDPLSTFCLKSLILYTASVYSHRSSLQLLSIVPDSLYSFYMYNKYCKVLRGRTQTIICYTLLYNIQYCVRVYTVHLTLIITAKGQKRLLLFLEHNALRI